MNNNVVMVISELEDGRDKIHAKNHKPEKYNLNNKKDLKIISDYKISFIKNKSLCYNKDLTLIQNSLGLKANERVYVKRIRFEPYKDVFVKERTFTFFQ